jgi:hypothetical protein
MVESRSLLAVAGQPKVFICRVSGHRSHAYIGNAVMHHGGYKRRKRLPRKGILFLAHDEEMPKLTGQHPRIAGLSLAQTLLVRHVQSPLCTSTAVARTRISAGVGVRATTLRSRSIALHVISNVRLFHCITAQMCACFSPTAVGK